MRIQVRYTIPEERLAKDNLDEYIDSLHDAFRRNMGEQLERYTPYHHGTMQRSWVYQRINTKTSVISNTTPQAGYLQGTGLWGPYQKVIRPREKKFFRFYWRYYDAIFVKRYVKGINPHRVHGAPGEIYDFIERMNTAIKHGYDRTMQEIEGL